MPVDDIWKRKEIKRNFCLLCNFQCPLRARASRSTKVAVSQVSTDWLLRDLQCNGGFCKGTVVVKL